MPTAHHQELSGGERTTDPVCLCQLPRPPSQEYIHLPPNLKYFKHCSSCLGLRHQGERHQETQNVNVAMHCHLAKVDVFSLRLVRGSCFLLTARALSKQVMQLEQHTPKQKGCSVAEKKTLPHIRGQEQTTGGDWGSGSRYRACVKCMISQVQSQYYQRKTGVGSGGGVSSRLLS